MTPTKSEEDREDRKQSEPASLQELWREPPQIDWPFGKFPIDLEEMSHDINWKAEELRARIEQRKQAQKKLQSEK